MPKILSRLAFKTVKIWGKEDIKADSIILGNKAKNIDKY